MDNTAATPVIAPAPLTPRQEIEKAMRGMFKAIKIIEKTLPATGVHASDPAVSAVSEARTALQALQSALRASAG